MKIVFDNIIFSLQQSGGISVVWFELLKRILKDNDFNAKFIEFQNNNTFGNKLDIPFFDLINNNLSKYPIKVQRYLNPKITTEKCLFHSSYYRTAFDSNFINITTVHDFTYEYYFKGLPQAIHHIQKGKAIKNSKKIICVSNNTKLDLLKFYPMINEDDVKVVYNGVSEDYHLLLPIENNQIANLIPYQSKEYVLYVGDRKSEYKNFKMLVEACRIAKFPLVIIGGGILSINEKSILIQKLGVNHFFHLNEIVNAKLNILYNNAAYFVYPSLYEGFGIPVIEAQKAGCPVICTDQSSIPEVVGKGAFIIKDISAMKIADIMLQNKSKSFQTNLIIEEGFVNACRFSWDKCYQETKQIYSNVYSTFF